MVTGATAGAAGAAAGRDDTNEDEGSDEAPLVTNDPVTLTKAIVQLAQGEARGLAAGGGYDVATGRSGKIALTGAATYRNC